MATIEVDLRPQPHQRRPDRLRVVGDDNLLRQLVPQLEQPLGDEGVVRVADLPRSTSSPIASNAARCATALELDI